MLLICKLIRHVLKYRGIPEQYAGRFYILRNAVVNNREINTGNRLGSGLDRRVEFVFLIRDAK